MNVIKKIILSPFALLYGVITGVRNLLYDWRVFKSTSFDIHTICVGNLAVGGAGKTPLVQYLITLLKPDFKVATLSRGYKRTTNGFLLANETSTASDVGDEPLFYKHKFSDIIVSVDAKRVNGVKQLMSGSPSPQVVLLDDAFQHRAIKCGLNIVVSEYSNLYLTDDLMPIGRLRESKKGISRADIIIISKTPEKSTAIDLRNVLKDIKPAAYQKVFFSYLKYGELYGFTKPTEMIHTLNDLFRYRVVAFTGISNPEPMITWLKEFAVSVEHLRFNDHHEYTLADIDFIKTRFDSYEGGGKILVTTEKDMMRLKHPSIVDYINTLPLYVLPIEVDFKDKTQEFNETILNYVRTNRIYHQKYS